MFWFLPIYGYGIIEPHVIITFESYMTINYGEPIIAFDIYT